MEHALLLLLFYDRSGRNNRAYGEQNRIFIPLRNTAYNRHLSPLRMNVYASGVDLVGITRAFWANIRQGQWNAGQGGSTITQQLVKNAFLSREKTLKRKIKEAYLAIKMERQFTKSEILEMYLNQIYFSHGAYGIEAASRIYFNKSASQLTIAEAALLAGIPVSKLLLTFYQFDSGAEEKNCPAKNA